MDLCDLSRNAVPNLALHMAAKSDRYLRRHCFVSAFTNLECVQPYLRLVSMYYGGQKPVSTFALPYIPSTLINLCCRYITGLYRFFSESDIPISKSEIHFHLAST